MKSGPAVYRMADLTKTYGDLVANDRISFDVHEGEILGLLGPNGAGKTTLIRQMLGLITPTSGSVEFCGRPLRDARDFLAPRVGYTPQNPYALEDLTAVQALRLSGCLRGIRRARDEAEALIRDFGLWDVRRLPIRHLSGGQRRLVGLAAALIGSPKVLILDEPTAALDADSRRRIWKRVTDLNASRGTTIIFVTHQVHEIDSIVHRVAILRRGRLAGVGTPAEIKSASNRLFRIDFTLRADRATALDTANLPGLRRIGPETFTIPITDGDPDVFVSDVLQRLPVSSYEDFHVYRASMEDAYLDFGTD
jgi:ABC-2 type transport system ATP-binding protein